MKKFNSLCILLGIVILAVLIWKIGPGHLWNNLIIMGWGLVPLLLIEAIAQILHCFGWQHCLTGAHRSLPFHRVFLIRMSGFAINHLTPSAEMGGEITKGTLLSMQQRGPHAATSVIIGKLSYSLSQILFVVTGSVVVIWSIKMPPGIFPAMLIGSAFIGAGSIAFSAIQRYGKLGAVLRWLVSRKIGGNWLKKTTTSISNIDREMKLFYENYPMELIWSMLWHAAGFACGLLQSFYFFYLLTGSPSFSVATAVWFLGSWFDLMSFAVPSNIGVQEGTRVLTFKLLALSTTMGMTYGIALRFEQMTMAVLGLVMYIIFMIPVWKTSKADKTLLFADKADKRR